MGRRLALRVGDGALRAAGWLMASASIAALSLWAYPGQHIYPAAAAIPILVYLHYRLSSRPLAAPALSIAVAAASFTAASSVLPELGEPGVVSGLAASIGFGAAAASAAEGVLEAWRSRRAAGGS